MNNCRNVVSDSNSARVLTTICGTDTLEVKIAIIKKMKKVLSMNYAIMSHYSPSWQLSMALKCPYYNSSPYQEERCLHNKDVHICCKRL